jgi:hypothetical protein
VADSGGVGRERGCESGAGSKLSCHGFVCAGGGGDGTNETNEVGRRRHEELRTSKDSCLST